MIIGTILLTRDNQYVLGEDNHLPARGNHDKKLLTRLAKGHSVSHKGWDMLPQSIRANVFVTDTKPTFPVTIDEIDALSDFLFVSHSDETNTIGKIFRLDSFELLVKDKNVSIYARRENSVS